MGAYFISTPSRAPIYASYSHSIEHGLEPQVLFAEPEDEIWESPERRIQDSFKRTAPPATPLSKRGINSIKKTKFCDAHVQAESKIDWSTIKSELVDDTKYKDEEIQELKEIIEFANLERQFGA